MSNFTSGPWRVKHTEKVSYVFSKTKLADVFSETFRDIENQHANAHLIAAAPEMYEALTGIVEEMALADFDPTDEDTWYGRAIAILAKVDGRAL